MTTLKISKVGNSLGTIFPKEILDKLGVGEGDTVFVTETPNGIQLSACDPAFEAAMAAYRKVNDRYRNALRELA